jgi:hypothetical protein
MNFIKKLWLCIVFAVIFSAIGSTLAWAGTGAVQVVLRPPAGTLKMGDTPNFAGDITNLGPKPIHGLIGYLSLVSLEPGHEEPVDLEDWSAQKAIRIDHLYPGEIDARNWSMRLIKAGRFGVALTVVDPMDKKPVISELVPFEIQPKTTLASGRILPVAIGEPLLLLTLLGTYYVCLLWKMRRSDPSS